MGSSWRTPRRAGRPPWTGRSFCRTSGPLITRCRAAGLPDEVAHVSKPNQAWAMLKRAVEHDVPFAWVTGDCIDGDYRRLRVRKHRGVSRQAIWRADSGLLRSVRLTVRLDCRCRERPLRHLGAGSVTPYR
ncbi:MAG TPA: hypothetical protein DEP84_26020 [Chloroflexi bacterium]|nr:hypothetical protein [Chloroflexota bacterium]